VQSGKLATVAEIGTALRAGTNCGSCLPELATILREAEGAASRALQEETLAAE
jgi:assimilatory nitrate reductase catalytic subunit